jgi:hypothetical protein
MKLSCRDQAILVLRWFRDRTRIDALGRDHGISRATAYGSRLGITRQAAQQRWS